MSSTYDIRDPRFQALIIGHARLETLWTGSRWAEGPVYVPAAKALVWSDIPNDRLLRYDETSGAVSVFEQPCGYQNGHALDAEGRIVACEHGGRRISRLGHDGVWTELVARTDGRRFNSPNDVVVKSDGTIWFSDPTYGINSAYEGHAAESEIGACHVWCFDPRDGSLRAVVTDMVRPNGLAFSPDERLLYVAETGASHVPDLPAVIRAYDLEADGTVSGGRVFATSPAGFYDGFRSDRHGNIWASTADAVAVHAPDGTLIGRIPVPELVSNLTFGGPKRNRLYITAQTSLYAIYVNAHGAV